MKSSSTLTVVASLITAAFISIPCAYAQAFEENFPAADTEVEAIELADLEKAFWICDYEATTYGVGAVDAEACVIVTEGLKREKFGGDFEALADWWRDQKYGVHDALERAREAQAAKESAELGEFPDSI
jgi:hypothetical protein